MYTFSLEISCGLFCYRWHVWNIYLISINNLMSVVQERSVEFLWCTICYWILYDHIFSAQNLNLEYYFEIDVWNSVLQFFTSMFREDYIFTLCLSFKAKPVCKKFIFTFVPHFTFIFLPYICTSKLLTTCSFRNFEIVFK